MELVSYGILMTQKVCSHPIGLCTEQESGL